MNLNFVGIFLFLSCSVFAMTMEKNSPLSVNYWGSVTQKSIFSADSYSNNKSALMNSNMLFLNYKLGGTQFGGIVVGGDIQPLNFEKSQIYNPAFRIGDNQLIATKTFKLASDLRFIIPVNEESKKQKMFFAFQTTQIGTFRPISSSFFIYSFNRLRWNLLEQGSQGGKFILYDRSTFNLEASNNINLSFISLFQISQNNKSKSISPEIDFVRMGPGITLNITKDFNISPYFTINALNPIITDTNLFVIASGKLF